MYRNCEMFMEKYTTVRILLIKSANREVASRWSWAPDTQRIFGKSVKPMVDTSFLFKFNPAINAYNINVQNLELIYQWTPALACLGGRHLVERSVRVGE